MRGKGAKGDNIPGRRKRICREPYMIQGPTLTGLERQLPSQGGFVYMESSVPREGAAKAVG